MRGGRDVTKKEECRSPIPETVGVYISTREIVVNMRKEGERMRQTKTPPLNDSKCGEPVNRSLTDRTPVDVNEASG